LVDEDVSTRKLLLGDEKFSWTTEVTDVSCYNFDDGKIAVKGQDGSFFYQYSLDGSDWIPTNDYTNDTVWFYNMSAGDTAVWVRDDSPTPDTSGRIPITINQPDSLVLSLDVQNWSCGGDSCVGSITANITGGTSPYIVELDGASTEKDTIEDNSHIFTDLCAGNYTVNVTDDNGCTIDGLQRDTIVNDIQKPSCTDFPDDYTMTIDQFNALDSTYAYLAETGSFQEQNYAPDEDTITYTLNGNNFNDLFLNFTITQTGTGEWETSDSVAFWLDYNKDDVVDFLLYADSSDHVAPSDSVALPEIASGKSINILIIYISGDDKSYSFDDVTLSGNSMAASIPTSISGEPTGCTDDLYGTPDITYSDGSIEWVCNVSGNKEFWFERTFTVSDGCGNYITRDHIIGVGDYPWIDEPKDTILDNCNFVDIQIPVPNYGDACDSDAYLSYVIRAQGETSNVAAGSVNDVDTDITVTFTQPEVNDTIYEVTWTATDVAGLITNVVQDVKVLRPMTITLNPAEDDFCSGELVSFEIVVEGGTGSYLDPDISPSGGDLTRDLDDTFTYETDQLDLNGTTDLTINFTDDNNIISTVNVQGGCFTGNQIFYHGTGANDSYTIHENISTNELEREN
jgi:hypothetical protein